MVLSENIVTALYIAASVLFILSLGGLSGQESAKRAVWYGIVGMAVAVIGTIFSPAVTITSSLLPLLVVGAVIGGIVAMRVEMTGMPQLVAALHSFVGLAAVFIGINSDIMPPEGLMGAEKIIHEVEIFVGVFIGAITFTGSVVAYGKLAGILDGKPLTLPGRNFLNVGMVLVSIYLGYLYMSHARIMDFVGDDSDRACLRSAYGAGHWRRRYACCGIYAEQLFRLGGGAATGFPLGQ